MACDGYAALKLTMKTAANGYFEAICGSLFLTLCNNSIFCSRILITE